MENEGYTHALSSAAEAAAGYLVPIKVAMIEKLKARGGRWEGGKGGNLSYLFLLPTVPRTLSFSFSPASLQRKEASAEERATQALKSSRHRIFLTWLQATCKAVFLLLSATFMSAPPSPTRNSAKEREY